MTCSDIVLVTDAWLPQTNGVVRTLQTVAARLEAMGRQVTMVTPLEFRTVPCPTYPEIRLSLDGWRLAKKLEALAPRHIHIATEGPLGILARRWCLKHGYPFTTAFHTRFPEYLARSIHVPPSLTYRWLRYFHRPASAMLVPTPSMLEELKTHGFTNGRLWTRGVDTALFHPIPAEPLPGQGPHWLYVGRVSVEKNLPAFLALDLPGTKHVVGGGPAFEQLKRQFPATNFAGMLHGEELRRYYAMSDVFVFPSRTDTFGLVMLEALACGTPVAAFPVTGPLDVITDPAVGSLDEDLRTACLKAHALSREACRAFAARHSWDRCAEQFAEALAPISPVAKAA